MVDKQVKKRRRKVLVCKNCREKKRKCDRDHPCSACKEHDVADSCSYFEIVTDEVDTQVELQAQLQSHVPIEMPVRREVKELREKVDLLLQATQGESSMSDAKLAASPDVAATQYSLRGDIEEDDPLINFYCAFEGEDASGKCTNMISRPLSWFGILKKDPGLKLFWLLKQLRSHCVAGKAENQVGREKHEVINEIENKPDELFEHDYSLGIEGRYPVDLRQVCGLASGITYLNSSSKNKVSLIDEVKAELPKRGVILRLLLQFFTILYPYFPLIDEIDFRIRISKILGPASNDNEYIESIHLEDKSDWNYLSMLLILTRLAYLSFLKNNVRENEAKLKSNPGNCNCPPWVAHLLKNPIGINVIDVAYKCMKQNDFLINKSIPILQNLLLFRMYKDLAPEEGDIITGNSYRLDKIITSMALEHYLNIDPEYIYIANSDSKTHNLRRKMWYYVLFIDTIDAMLYGSQLLIQDTCYNTKLPTFDPKLKNAIDDDLEKSAIEGYHYYYCFIVSARKVLQYTFLNSRVRLSTFITAVQEFDDESENTFKTIESYLGKHCLHPKGVKLIAFRLRLYSKVFLMFMYYYLYLYHERAKKRGFFQYLTKSLSILTELTRYDFVFFTKCESYFGSEFSFIIAPLFTFMNFSETLINLSLTIRIKSCLGALHEYEDTANVRHSYEPVLIDFLADMKSLSKKHLESSALLAFRYFSSWKVLKLFRYTRKIMETDILYLNNKKLTNECNLWLDESQIYILKVKYEETLSLISQSLQGQSVLSTCAPTYDYILMSTGEKVCDTNTIVDDIWFLIITLKRHRNNPIGNQGKTDVLNKDSNFFEELDLETFHSLEDIMNSDTTFLLY